MKSNMKLHFPIISFVEVVCLRNPYTHKKYHDLIQDSLMIFHL